MSWPAPGFCCTHWNAQAWSAQVRMQAKAASQAGLWWQVVLGPQHANVFAKAGLSRNDVHELLMRKAGRKLGEIRRGGIWRGPEGAARWPFRIDLDDGEVGDPGEP